MPYSSPPSLVEPPQPPPPPDLRTLLSLSVKLAGVGVPNPTKSANNDQTTSSVCTIVLTNSLLDGTPLTITDHQKAMQDGRSAAQAFKRANTTANLSTLTDPMSPFDTHQTIYNNKTGAWISIQPTLVNGLSLLKDERRDTMRRRYGLELLDLPRCFDGCGAKFTIKHALACKKGGFVVGRHNEVKADTGELAIQVLGSNQVRDKPKIITCRDTPDVRMPSSAHNQPLPIRLGTPSPHSSTKLPPPPDHGHFFNRGELLIAGLWEKQTACVINMRVIDSDQPSYCGLTLAHALTSQEESQKEAVW